MRHGLDHVSFSKNCERAITVHSWPGNVRELENAVERAVILADENKQIEADLLGLAPLAPKGKSKEEQEGSNLEIETIEQVEKLHIEKILKKCDGNRTHAAKKLGLNVRTLRNKIKDFEIEN
jgi:DNA-binding NtrC family response regulator